MPTSTPRLRDYRDKLTPGTVLGLSYKVDDPAYLVTRALPIQQLTVQEIQGEVVVFRRQGGHALRLPLTQPLTYLRFGAFLPYHPHESILPPPDPFHHDASTDPCESLRNAVAAAVHQVLDQHTQTIDKYLSNPRMLVTCIIDGVLTAIRNHRTPATSMK